MNSYLCNLYLRLTRIDSRYIRLALLVLAVAGTGGTILSIPIHGDVGS